MNRMAILLGALALLLSPLAGASASPVRSSAPATEWTIPEAATQYQALIGPFNKSRLPLNRMTIQKSNARSYCMRLVRSLDTLNVGLSRGLWPATIEGEVNRFLRALVLLRSKYRQCQTARTGADAVDVLTRNNRLNQRLWDAAATEAGLIRLGLGLPPS